VMRLSVVDRATVRQRKTQRPIRFELTEQTRQPVDDYLKVARKISGDFFFIGRQAGQSMTLCQYGPLASYWFVSIGLGPHSYRTHSLRRTKATPICRRDGNL
jgi:integrase